MEIKKSNTANLEKYTKLFRLLGLVLTLLVVYVAIEHKVYDTTSKGLEIISNTDFTEEEEVLEIEIEQVVPPPPPQNVSPELIEVVEDIVDVEEAIIETTETDESEKIDIIDIVDIVEVEQEEEFIEDVPFAIIEDVPIYPGCEKEKSKKSKKDCFNRGIQKLVAKNFDANLATDLGLSKGKIKIYVQFKITTTGSIEILGARAPHKRLEKEAKRVVNLLPKMTPGKQRGRPVNVTYMLPISFNVE
ncbi:MAG: energy transducer TonB [Flavobacteriaceae bacterium]